MLSEDVFLLERFPCKMVEVVGWVAGIDEKEKTQTVYRESKNQKSERYEAPDTNSLQ